MSYFDYERTLLGYMEGLKMQLLARPLNLGGVASSGGSVGSSLGYIGQLPQTRVVYDLTEAASSLTPVSGASLLDNLNHIRYRIQTLEEGTGPGTITVKENGVIVSSGITVIDFIGGTVDLVSADEVTVTFAGGGGGVSHTHVYNELSSGTSHFDTEHVFNANTLQVYYNGVRQDDAYFTPDEDRQGFTLVGFSAVPGDEVMIDYDIAATSSGVTASGGHTIAYSGVPFTQRGTLNFEGSGVTVVDDPANNATKVTITGGGGTGTGNLTVTWSGTDSTNWVTDTFSSEASTNYVTEEVIISRPVLLNRIGWYIMASGTYNINQTTGLHTQSPVIRTFASQQAYSPGWNYIDIDPPLVLLPGNYYFQLYAYSPVSNTFGYTTAGTGAGQTLCGYGWFYRNTTMATTTTYGRPYAIYLRGKIGTLSTG